MPVTARETILQALLALLAGSAAFQTIGRRNRGTESIGPSQSPALFMLENAETYERPDPSLPPVRTLTVAAVLINDVGTDENAIPSAAINDALDRLDAALAPDSQQSNFCTLGGLVYAVFIEGKVEKSPGEMTGKSVAIVPIKILLP